MFRGRTKYVDSKVPSCAHQKRRTMSTMARDYSKKNPLTPVKTGIIPPELSAIILPARINFLKIRPIGPAICPRADRGPLQQTINRASEPARSDRAGTKRDKKALSENLARPVVKRQPPRYYPAGGECARGAGICFRRVVRGAAADIDSPRLACAAQLLSRVYVNSAGALGFKTRRRHASALITGFRAPP